VQRLIRLYREHPVFRRRRWFQGRPIRGAGVADISWYTPDGNEMTEQDWQEGYAKSLGVFLNGKAIHGQSLRGEPVVDESFYLLFNAHHEPLTFALPKRECGDLGGGVDTAAEAAASQRGSAGTPVPYRAGEHAGRGRAFIVLRCIG
jgi:glycogen operon protein